MGGEAEMYEGAASIVVERDESGSGEFNINAKGASSGSINLGAEYYANVYIDSTNKSEGPGVKPSACMPSEENPVYQQLENNDASITTAYSQLLLNPVEVKDSETKCGGGKM